MEHPVQSSPQRITAWSRSALNAIRENEKTFPIFARRLASNEPKEFVNAAEKLTTWLTSEKAYYPSARPKIVELLEIALSTSTGFAHHSGEIAEHLRQLVRAVIPFKHLFRENELQSRLQRVILDTTLFLSRISASTHPAALSEGSTITSIPPSTHAHSVDLQPIAIERNKMNERGGWAREEAILAMKLELEMEDGPRLGEFISSGTSIAIDDAPSTSPYDLTGRVTKSSTYPFASGGFGDIYRGNLNFKGSIIDVAIKTTRVYLQHDQHLPKKVKQFRKEVAVWWKLKHPNVLPLLGTVNDASMHPDIPAMVCPWVKNGALSTYLGETDLSPTKKFTLIDDVANGLQYLHSWNVVHGDISGSNVLVTGDGRACIADFGLSTLLTQLSESSFTTTRQAKGTVRWMAPELLDPDQSHVKPTMQTDVYSFGSIMLQVLTGNIPYHYLPRSEQVIFAVAKGMRPRQPEGELVADHWWKFIQWCWMAVGSATPRPSSDEVAEFTGRELVAITMAAVV